MSRTLLDADRFTVRRVPVHLPDGRTTTKDIVDHPPAVAILPFLDADRVVMIHNHRYTIGRDLLEVPAGKIEAGETPEEAAGRECREETGYRPGELRVLCRFYPSPGVLTEEMTVFVARDLQRDHAAPQETEQIRVEVVPLGRLTQMAEEGLIEDAKTLVALLYYQRFNRGGDRS
jgi:ADP-ribose pyrophosphatase